MKMIYFALRNEGTFTAATSLSDIAGFMGYSADRLRRLMKGKEVIEIKTGRVYRTYLSTVTGRGDFMRFHS